LSTESVGFAFFDGEISDDTKIKMVQALENDNNVDRDSIYLEKHLRVKLNEIPCFINI